MALLPTANSYEPWDTGTYSLALQRIEPRVAEFKNGDEPRFEFYFVDPAEIDNDDAKALAISTGRNFGSTKATFTKMLAGILGYTPEQAQVRRFDLERLYFPASKLIFDITVTKEKTSTGGETNKLAAIKVKGATKPLDITPFLVDSE